MILSNITYLLRTYLRSNAYFVPCILYVFITMLLYSYKPNPIADSYSITAIFLFFISCWVGRSLYHAESPDQRAVTLTHSPHRWKYYLSEWLSAIAVTFILAAIAILYPVITMMFQGFPNVNEWVTAISGHFTLGILGSSLALLTQRSMIPQLNYGLNLLILWSITGVLHTQFVAILPDSVQFISWVLPPVLPLIQQMLTPESIWPMLGLVIYSIVYAFILGSCYVYLSSKKRDVML